MKNIQRNTRWMSALLALLLVCAMAVSMAACGSEAEKTREPAPAAQPAEETPAPTPEPTPTPVPTEAPPEPGFERLRDEDGDGVISYEFTYKGATVYALLALDPSCVFVGTAEQNMGVGETIDAMATKYDAIGGMNAGGFLDENGGGTGAAPYGITFSEGDCYNAVEAGIVCGLNSENELLAGYYTHDDCVAADITDAVTFGPVLVENGSKGDGFEQGLGARSAIGQREDGTIVMVVADGRQGYSIGLTFPDMVEILSEKFGCVTAVNMDGGNSSCMFYQGEIINNPANQASGSRPLPTAWLIKRAETKSENEDIPKSVDIKRNALGELYENENACGEELSARLKEFADSFVEAYYGFFGTKNADYYYPTLKQYVADESDLLSRMDQALMDRMWVNTGYNEFANKSFLGAYDNGDGSYTIEYALEITEFSTYWTYNKPDATLRITVYEAPDSIYGFLATATN